MSWLHFNPIDFKSHLPDFFLKSLYKLSIINFTVFYFKLGANHQVRKIYLIMIQYFLKSISYFAESESETFKASKYFIYASKLRE